jgi:hypothetical protein
VNTATVTANQTVHNSINFQDAMNFIEYLISPSTQTLIADYGKDTYGQPLFYEAVQPLIDNAPQPIVSWIQSYAFFNGTECPTQWRSGYPDLYS